MKGLTFTFKIAKEEEEWEPICGEWNGKDDFSVEDDFKMIDASNSWAKI